MAEDGRVYDGHTFLHGQNNVDDPSALNSTTAAKAVNRVFRGGRNRTRPPFTHNQFIFDEVSIQYKDIIRFGNYQGCLKGGYKKRGPGREDGAVVSVAGYIFFLTLVNEKFYVRLIFAGNASRLMHTWFCQSAEWLYVQNGEDRPIFWNGLFPSTARRAIPEENEMPIGTIMVAAHGRVFVSNAFDQIAASDIIYGSGLTRSDQNQKFTENLYWNEGGYFGVPTELGHITAGIVVARQDVGNRTQGEVVFLNENGASAIEASIPRGQWKDAQVQTVTLTGRGAVSNTSVINVNNDVFMRSEDGLASYTISRTEQKNRLSFGKLSRHVNFWLDDETEWLLQFASSIYFDNRVLTTVSPFVALPNNADFGSHRYHRGLVALDLDQASDVQGDSSFNWDGLWTGVRPAGLMKLGYKAFVWSYDSDGENRIYEIRKQGIHDRIEDQIIQTKWHYMTKRFDWRETGRSNNFEVKKFVGGELWISDIRDIIKVGVDSRPDNLPCWGRAMHKQEFGSKFEGEWKFSLPRYKRFKFTSPDDSCEPGAPYPVNHGSQRQIMVYGEGAVQVDRMRVAMAATNDPNSPIGDCNPNDPTIGIDCKIENDYSYSIADSR